MTKKIEVPKDHEPKPKEPEEPLIAWSFGDDSDARDVSKPVAFDEHGNGLYAPRGRRIRL